MVVIRVLLEKRDIALVTIFVISIILSFFVVFQHLSWLGHFDTVRERMEKQKMLLKSYVEFAGSKGIFCSFADINIEAVVCAEFDLNQLPRS